MLYNRKVILLYCVFHGIRFKVNGRLVVGMTINFFYTHFCIKQKNGQRFIPLTEQRKEMIRTFVMTYKRNVHTQ